jgi:hypothetical protein
LRMMVLKKDIGKRFGLLATLVTAVVIATTGVALAQSSTANALYESSHSVTTPSDAAQGGAGQLSNGTSAASDVSAATRLPNGGFESGDFGGWTRISEVGGNGDWFVYSGRRSPLSRHTIAAPPSGRFAATTDQEGPGSHVLYRIIRLKGGMKHKLSFVLYYHNFAEGFSTPKTLRFSGIRNQQYRVDVLKLTANPFSVKRKAILATIFRTRVGDPNRLAPKVITFNLTPYAGKIVLLRFAEVDNVFYFLASVDKVKVTSKRR